MNRRNFLSRAGLLLGGGIIARPDVLDAFAQLSWKRRVWTGATFGSVNLTDFELRTLMFNAWAKIDAQLFPVCTPIETLLLRAYKPRSSFEVMRHANTVERLAHHAPIQERVSE